MATNKTYLISGANKGIGLALATLLLSRPNTTVIAAVRNPEAAKSTLHALPLAKDSQVLLAAYDAVDPTSAQALVTTLKNEHGVSKLDVLIANAGIHESIHSTLALDSARAARVMQVNAVGPLQLAHAAKGLLQAAPSPVFAATSSAAGSIGYLDNMPTQVASTPYGASKAALNWYLRRLHFEEQWLTIVAVHPGLIMTDMAKGVDLGDLPEGAFDAIEITAEQSAEGYLGVLDKLVEKKEEWGGRLLSYTGDVMPW